ncbi:MAG: LysE family transporter, partial [Bacteroidales bacterium]
MELPDPRDHLRICGGRAAGTPFGLPHLAHIAVWLEKGLPGGLFLLYLAFQALQSWKKGGENIPVSGGSSRKTLLNATLVNFLNPGPYLGWSIVIGPLFLKGW